MFLPSNLCKTLTSPQGRRDLAISAISLSRSLNGRRDREAGRIHELTKLNPPLGGRGKRRCELRETTGFASRLFRLGTAGAGRPVVLGCGAGASSERSSARDDDQSMCPSRRETRPRTRNRAHRCGSARLSEE